ncbi:uncharacterized protein TNCV_2037381 [Trichonephila clavipes]|nr:uncharacterized protein TNCV_2037381 [Trichonephila clavipes]
MNRLTPEQRFQIVQFYFENNGSVRNTYRALRPFYRRQNRPSEQLIRLTMERFRTTFTLIDNSHPQRHRTVRTEEAIATVERRIEEDPNESTTIEHRNWICVHPLYGRFCGRILSLVYADKPQTLDYLEDNIRRVIADIRPQMLEKVIENWTCSLDYIRASRGSHMPEIIFKIWLPKWEAKTKHGVSFVSAFLKTLDEDLKQQPVYQDSSKDALSDFILAIELGIRFASNQDPQDIPQQLLLGEGVHYHPSE